MGSVTQEYFCPGARIPRDGPLLRINKSGNEPAGGASPAPTQMWKKNNQPSTTIEQAGLLNIQFNKEYVGEGLAPPASGYQPSHHR